LPRGGLDTGIRTDKETPGGQLYVSRHKEGTGVVLIKLLRRTKANTRE